MKILIIRFSSIGDIVLTTPVIRCVKEQVKDIELHYCTKSQFKGILESNPYIDKIKTLDGSIPELIQDLKKEKYDLILDLHHNLRTLKIKWALGVKSYSFAKLNIEKFLLVNFRVNRLPDIHIVDRYLNTAKSLGVVNDNKGLDYFIPESDGDGIRLLPEEYQQGYIGLVIGAQHFTKRLPAHKLASICCTTKVPIVLLGGPEDNNEAEKVISMVVDNPLVYNACGKFNLNQSATLVRDARFIITHDTGLMHIAAAFKKKIFAVWGNTVPEFGMYPYQTEFFNIENKEVKCRPCSKIGYNKCPKKHFLCMESLSFDAIRKEANL